MAIHSKKKALMCKVFPSSLSHVAMKWFDGLEEGLISSFEELMMAFGARFVTLSSEAFRLFAFNVYKRRGDP